MDRLKKIEKMYGVDFGCEEGTTLAEYLTKHGFTALVKFLRLLDEKQNDKHKKDNQ